MKQTAKCLFLVTVSVFLCIFPSCTFRAPLPPFSAPLRQPFIKVLIQQDVKTISVICQGRIKVTSDTGEYLGIFTPTEKIPLEFNSLPTGIQYNNQWYNGKLLVLTSFDKIPIGIGNRLYRGDILIHLNERSNLEVINRLEIEDYIKGLMKSEISPGWPTECLKAQAVVARTYSLYRLDLNKDGIKDRIYDVNASIESQVYIGLSGEDPRTDIAVDSTRGIILISGNKCVPAFYHACCGGHTEDSRYVFNEHPALKGVPCPYCKDSPHYEWETKLYASDIRERLMRQNIPVGNITSLSIKTKTPNGRVYTLAITHSLGEEVISGKDFRALMGYDIIRSTIFTISQQGDLFVFKGKGWGHGLGLCQWGAKGMAANGAYYQDILSYYYAQSSLQRIY